MKKFNLYDITYLFTINKPLLYKKSDFESDEHIRIINKYLNRKTNPIQLILIKENHSVIRILHINGRVFSHSTKTAGYNLYGCALPALSFPVNFNKENVFIGTDNYDILKSFCHDILLDKTELDNVLLLTEINTI